MINNTGTDKLEPLFLEPAFQKEAIAVVFSTSNEFVPYFSGCLQSLLEHCSDCHNYDVIVLHLYVSESNRHALSRMVRGYDNVSLRFYCVNALVKNHNLKANAHISTETYFRFLIQELLPDYHKVLYLDSDVIIQTDIAELYQTELDSFLLAAARDPEFLGNLHGANKQIQNYIRKHLGMRQPDDYFQAGVLLFNVTEMRKAYSISQWLNFAAKQYRYLDQDILNVYCEGRVKYLDMAWNLLTDCDHTRISRIIVHAPKSVQDAYSKARENPKIIHYAGHKKPWQDSTEDMAGYFWEYIRKTPYYEQVLQTMVRYQAQEATEAARKKYSPYRLLRRWAKKLLHKK